MTVLTNEEKPGGAIQEIRTGTADKIDVNGTEKAQIAGGEKLLNILGPLNRKSIDVENRKKEKRTTS